MTYSKAPSLPVNLTEALSALAEGASLLLEDNEHSLNKMRTQIYNYLYHHNLKSLYKLKRLTPKTLLILRVANLNPRITFFNDSPGIEFCKNCLLSFDNEDTVSDYLHSSNLSSEEKIVALTEWRRING